jgi:hypothetical protein
MCEFKEALSRLDVTFTGLMKRLTPSSHGSRRGTKSSSDFGVGQL